MKQIIPANDAILQILGNAKTSTEQYRMMTCCVPYETEEGILLFHVLTRELLLLTPQEFSSAEQLPYLRDHWFFVPKNTNDAELISFVRWMLQNYKGGRRKTSTQSYTILTTTECNARCYYCCQGGCSNISMDTDTAHKVAAYIREHCDKKKVYLTWFGGEPLVNDSVIDLICKDLQAAGISYESKMVTNAYLFSSDIVSRAKELWNLSKTQITLDGTEQIYNHSKDYIYQNDNPYQIVISNIERLLDAGISVQIRLNISPLNMDDLLELVQELSGRFGRNEKLRVYPIPLFDFAPDANEKESRKELFAAQTKLEDAILSVGLSRLNVRPLRRDLKLRHCMADGGKAVLIAPDGHIGLCIMHIQDEFIGHIDKPEVDSEVVQRWQERGQEASECKTCFYYPECTHLKMCTGSSECYEHKRMMYRQRVEQSMLYELQQWKKQAST